MKKLVLNILVVFFCVFASSNSSASDSNFSLNSINNEPRIPLPQLANNNDLSPDSLSRRENNNNANQPESPTRNIAD